MYLDRRTQRRLQRQEEAKAAAHRLEEEEARVQHLMGLLANANTTQLLGYLEQAIRSLPEPKCNEIFGQLIYETTIAPLSPTQVIAKVQQFHADSFDGKYYAPFELNSKNYTWVPPETETWFDKLTIWLDRCCELLEEGHPTEAKQGLGLLIELIANMGNDEIVFADELGDWMIHTKHDYLAIYQSLSPTP